MAEAAPAVFVGSGSSVSRGNVRRLLGPARPSSSGRGTELRRRAVRRNGAVQPPDPPLLAHLRQGIERLWQELDPDESAPSDSARSANTVDLPKSVLWEDATPAESARAAAQAVALLAVTPINLPPTAEVMESCLRRGEA